MAGTEDSRAAPAASKVAPITIIAIAAALLAVCLVLFDLVDRSSPRAGGEGGRPDRLSTHIVEQDILRAFDLSGHTVDAIAVLMGNPGPGPGGDRSIEVHVFLFPDPYILGPSMGDRAAALKYGLGPVTPDMAAAFDALTPEEQGASLSRRAKYIEWLLGNKFGYDFGGREKLAEGLVIHFRDYRRPGGEVAGEIARYARGELAFPYPAGSSRTGD